LKVNYQVSSFNIAPVAIFYAFNSIKSSRDDNHFR